MHKVLIGLLALVGFALVGASHEVSYQQASDFIRVDSENHYIVDKYNRVRFFHGTNSVQKSVPWYPQEDTLNIQRIQAMQDMGFNALRLGVMWPGYEPQRGQWNESYIQKIGR
jgi:endoglycosylceramidase